jgi:hypothetical protein
MNNILVLLEREEEICCDYIEKPITPLVKEGTSLPRSNMGQTHRQERDHLSLLKKAC